MKRQPSVVEIYECGLLVKHTHDIEEAERAAAAYQAANDQGDTLPGPGRQVWVRIIHALPNSWAASEGYSWRVEPARQGERGAFRAVTFYYPYF